MSDINGVLGPICDDITGVAIGTVSDPKVSIEDALAALGAADAPVLALAPLILEASPERYRVHIVGNAGDEYLSNGTCEARIPRNKECVVDAWALEVLKQTQGVSFTYLPA